MARRFLLAALVVIAMVCVSFASSVSMEVDASQESSVWATLVDSLDAPFDASSYLESDAEMDAEADMEMEQEMEVDAEAEAEVDAESELDAEADAEVDAEADVEAESESEMEALPAAGQACGPNKMGKCTAQASWCPAATGTLTPGYCSGSAVCCMPKAAAARSPSASNSMYAGPNLAVPAGGPLARRTARVTIPANILALGVQYTRVSKAAPVSNACPKTAPAMTTATLTTILRALWTAFGATSAQANSYAASNLKQILRESSYCPNIRQGQIGDVNNRNGNLAGGLVQFIESTFQIWHVAGTANNRFNPVSNLAAAINAQINSKTITPTCHKHRVLNGCMGWSPQGGSNPYKR